ncbi:MAG TPA: hypothetical protein VLE73_06605 [Candidatus Saccharimonadales bacterium]|nr:hypothetical protein [Candidatus Saccharimonadales bacterium]
MIPLRAEYHPGPEIPRVVNVPEALRLKIGVAAITHETAQLPSSPEPKQASGALAVAKTVREPHVLTM